MLAHFLALKTVVSVFETAVFLYLVLKLLKNYQILWTFFKGVRITKRNLKTSQKFVTNFLKKLLKKLAIVLKIGYNSSVVTLDKRGSGRLRTDTSGFSVENVRFMKPGDRSRCN